MRLLAPLLLCVLTARAADDNRPLIVVELFTSEGCSSCPMADALLAKLERSQMFPNVRVVGLEEHVDYWNNLGWVDRFASPQFSSRQNQYAQHYGADAIYTPQMVANGQKPFVAVDVRSASKAILESAANPSYDLTLAPERNPREPSLTDLIVHVRYLRTGSPVPADIFLAVTESRLRSTISNGENAGQTVAHGSVVRSFGVLGSIDRRPFNTVGLKSTLKLPEEWNRQNLRAVVFVQERQSHRITGAAMTELR